jgi:hypothetical protein
MAGLPSGDAQWEHQLIGQMDADRGANCQVFAHFLQGFVGDLLGWHAATADAREDFGNAF